MTLVVPPEESLETTAPEPEPPERRARRNRPEGRRSSRWLVVVGVLLVAVAPIAVVFVNSFNSARPGEPAQWSLGNWRDAFNSSQVWSAVETTLRLGVIRMVLAIALGVVFAWLITRTNMPGGRALEVAMWVAFFVPALPLTLGWMLLLDPDFGWLNEEIRRVIGGEEGPVDIYSGAGIIWVHLTATTVPYIVVLTAPTFRRMSTAMEESARMCGASKLRTAMRVTVPLMLPAILAAALLGFIWSLKAFEVELLLGQPVGIDVYSTRIYRLARDIPPVYGVATALGAGFVAIILVLALGYRRALRGRDFTTISAHTYNDERIELGRRGRWIAAACCWSFVAVGVLLPFAALTAGSFMRRFGFRDLAAPWTTDHWRNLFADPLFESSIGTSLWLGFWSVVLGVVLYGGVALFVIRTRGGTSSTVDLAAWMPVAVPGVLMGLGLLWIYLGTPLRSILYATLLGLVLAITINHMPTGVQQMKAALMQVNPDLEHAARISGAGRLRSTWSVLIPLLLPSLVSVALLTFVSAVREISTVVLLAGQDTTPVSVLLLEYSVSGELERAAAIGVVMTVVLTAIAVVALRLGNRSVGRS